MANFALYRHTTADALHRGANRVHAHAAPGQARHCILRGKSRQKNQIKNILVARRSKRSALYDLVLARHTTHPRYIDAPAVVTDFDDNIFTVATRPEANSRDRRLSGRRALRRRLDPVIHCVSNDMKQRLEQHLRYCLVRLGVFAIDHKSRRLGKLDRLERNPIILYRPGNHRT